MRKHRTYPCKLCMVTYGTLRTKKCWKEFIKQLDVSVSFWYRDELTSKCKFPKCKVDFPAVIIKDGSQMTVLMDAEDFKKIGVRPWRKIWHARTIFRNGPEQDSSR